MAEVKEFLLPDLGEGLTEAEVVRWLVAVGEVVEVDQPVVEVETAKAVVEVPCPYGGVVTARFGAEGDVLQVGRPLVTVAVGSGDGAAEQGGSPGPGGGSAGSGPGDGDEGSGNVLVGYGTGAASSRRRRRVRAVSAAVGHGAAGAAGSGVAEAAPNGHVRDGAAAAGAVRGALAGGAGSGGAAAGAGDAGGLRTEGAGGSVAEGADGGPVAVISPLVRRLAREKGLDLRQLKGSGPEGLILRADVERAEPAVLPGAGGAAEQAAAADGEVRVPLRGIRGAVAEKLSRSRREIPDATCWVDADATELLAARAAMNAAVDRAGAGERISVPALFARIVTAALARFPELNARVDVERGEIVRLPAVHLGFAAQTDRGLVVPVVRDAHSRTTSELSAELRRLTEAGRNGSLTPADLTGSTFTLNNYGVFGVDGSTPILNHPEAGMLGVGRITPKPWVHQGELAARQVVQLSLTFDHRVCDGGTAGGFLRFVADCVESPATLLASV
ncbi:dihydrolipoamide acetyltransferase family protein [Actinacidiphila guanduensis]|uniref:Dihydrolipoamide acetyltransferase component of pyruvate dehydrogenase complex n=1 Tax=Actinacidiphila guanduensis TaxID=310781 RepID=A0A1G9XES7_9ACTN|nr:dihydrolipoamide acetyltransferase family protein [Actinacidiphila guanduensis]SDM94946.1 pyruvate dehydrogenase E2 component (dihydrolipoamide acetyltransferase) [Actinacidiphila guanduensis]